MREGKKKRHKEGHTGVTRKGTRKGIGVIRRGLRNGKRNAFDTRRCPGKASKNKSTK